MSTLFYIACRECKVKLHIGQNSWIYTAQEHLKDLDGFLFGHQTHPLVFVSEHSPEWENFEDYVPGVFQQHRWDGGGGEDGYYCNRCFIDSPGPDKPDPIGECRKVENPKRVAQPAESS